METVAERFLRYAAFDTQSDELSETCPSTEKQKALGQQLVADMKAMGIADARMDENGYVYGTVPGDPSLPTIGLIAHMDTAPDAPGANIRAKIVPYNGEDVLLNDEKQIYLREDDYPILNGFFEYYWLFLSRAWCRFYTCPAMGSRTAMTSLMALRRIGYGMRPIPLGKCLKQRLP